MPDAHCLTGDQIEAIRQVAHRRQGVLWIGNMALEPWPGQGPAPLPSPFKSGTFELVPAGDHPILDGIDQPVMLETSVGWCGPRGQVAGTVDGQPGMVLIDRDDQREAWLTGLPMHTYVRKGEHSSVRTPTGGLELWRRLLIWLAQRQPLVRLDPFPPPNDYQRLRPWDVRDVPTAELLPMVCDDSALAIIFPYAPVGFETALLISPPPRAAVGRITELWQHEKLTPQPLDRQAGTIRVALNVPGDTELLAILIEFESQ